MLSELDLHSKFTDEMHDHINAIISSFPEENIREQASEWAERKRTLGGGLTSMPGKFDFNVTPYLREILDCLSVSSSVHEVYYMKGTQVGGTVGVIENHIGYCIDYGIGPALYVSGDQAMAEEQMEKRIDEMIYSAGLQGKVKANIAKKKGKSTGDRADSKSYGGTFMRAVGPHSESKLRTFPMMILWLDEIDVYPLTIKKGGNTTGNPIEKAIRRTDTYEDSRKIFGISTPKQKSTSQIEPLFEQGDKRYYNFECPECGMHQPFIWQNLKWEKKDNGKINIKYQEIAGVQIPANNPIWYECPHCHHKISEHEKYDLLLEEGHGGTAKWIPTKKPDRPYLRSYHTNALYGRRSWLSIVLQWERAQEDPLLLADFINDVLGETWHEQLEKPDEHELMRNAEDWETGYIPQEVIFLSIEADIQGDRIEAALLGHGRHQQTWVLDYWVFQGKPNLIEDQCWKYLDAAITAEYMRADNIVLGVRAALIDSQFYRDQVFAFCDQYDYHDGGIEGVFPLRGRDVLDAGRSTKLIASDIKTPVVGFVDQIFKKNLYSALRLKPHPDGFPNRYIHFPKTFGYEFYKQLTAEDVFVEIRKNGSEKVTIENRKQRRNEVFDIVKYGLVAYQFMISRYFEIENENRKLQKRRPIQQDHDIFVDAMESALYGDDYTPPEQPQTEE